MTYKRAKDDTTRNKPGKWMPESTANAAKPAAKKTRLETPDADNTGAAKDGSDVAEPIKRPDEYKKPTQSVTATADATGRTKLAEPSKPTLSAKASNKPEKTSTGNSNCRGSASASNAKTDSFNPRSPCTR